MSESRIDHELQEEAQAELENLALALSSPEALARGLGYWLRQRMPDRLSESMWVDIEGNRDKGLKVRIYERPLPRWPKLKATLGGLIGLKTFGFDISMQVYQTANGARVSLGMGGVAPFGDYQDVKPVATVSVRF